LIIGLLLCKGKDKVETEYVLKDINKAMGKSEYRLSNKISGKLKEDLPTIDDIELGFEFSQWGKTILSPCSIRNNFHRMWRPWWCWSGKPRKSKNSGNLDRICRYVFVMY
jgi:hypothetical protein